MPIITSFNSGISLYLSILSELVLVEQKERLYELQLRSSKRIRI